MPTRRSLHLVAAHVLARSRQVVTGRLGLRVVPGGFATPMFGTDERVLRVCGGWLFDERRTSEGMRLRALALHGIGLGEVAAWAGVTLEPGFEVGDDTPSVDDPQVPLVVEGRAAAALGAWLVAGAAAVDETVARLATSGAPTVLQLWPEHFDAGLDITTPGGRVNLGMSAGDGFCPEPYAYVGPWSAERDGDPSYWNAPFGAFLPASQAVQEGDPQLGISHFLRRGLALLGVHDA